MAFSFHGIAAVCAVGVALAGCGADQSATVVDSIPFDQLGESADQIVEGNRADFQNQLTALKGHPVVVNQWASWCGPCKFEFPFFRAMTKKYGGEVAFLGVNSNDSRDNAEAFLKENPGGFPSYYDRDSSIARAFEGGRAWPTTAFYNADGKRTNVHPGGYASQADLQEDIERHALNG